MDAFLLVYGIPDCVRYTFTSGGVGPRPISTTQILRLTAPLLYIIFLYYLYVRPPAPIFTTPLSIYSALSWNWPLYWFQMTPYTRVLVKIKKGTKNNPFCGARLSINIWFQGKNNSPNTPITHSFSQWAIYIFFKSPILLERYAPPFCQFLVFGSNPKTIYISLYSSFSS